MFIHINRLTYAASLYRNVLYAEWDRQGSMPRVAARCFSEATGYEVATDDKPLATAVPL